MQFNNDDILFIEIKKKMIIFEHKKIIYFSKVDINID